MNRGQRVVASAGLGVALAIVASAAVAKMNGPADGGWFMYSPNSTTTYSSASNSDVLRTAAVWLAAVAVWFLICWRMFRSDE